MPQLQHEDPHDLDTVVHEILEDLKHKDRHPQALQRLFDQTDLAHQHNR